jgi:nucleoside-diphosphate-sugar epimerase
LTPLNRGDIIELDGLGGIDIMKILVIGGTRFFGIPMVNALLEKGHDVTIATRGGANDSFGNRVKRIILDRTDAESIKSALENKYYDVVIDKIAYCSNDIKRILDVISCKKYVQMSSTAVYEPLHINTSENEFNGNAGEILWCEREDVSYSVGKQNAERAICQFYDNQKWIAIRYPYVIGEDDYTKRLYFYVEHVVKEIPMYIDNIDVQMSFINSKEAGTFLAYIIETDFEGAINGANKGTISIAEIIDYVEKKSGKKAILRPDGDVAPYNETPQYSIDISLAEKTGYIFSDIHSWMGKLLYKMIKM